MWKKGSLPEGPSTLIVVVAVYLSTEMLMSENGLLFLDLESFLPALVVE